MQIILKHPVLNWYAKLNSRICLMSDCNNVYCKKSIWYVPQTFLLRTCVFKIKFYNQNQVDILSQPKRHSGIREIIVTTLRGWNLKKNLLSGYLSWEKNILPTFHVYWPGSLSWGMMSHSVRTFYFMYRGGNLKSCIWILSMM